MTALTEPSWARHWTFAGSPGARFCPICRPLYIFEAAMRVFTVRVIFQALLFAVLLELETLASTPASETTYDRDRVRSCKATA
jgi:hypothetical protein